MARRGEVASESGQVNINGTTYNIDLAAHIAECDANYWRVMRLFPRLQERDRSSFGVTLAGRRALVSIEVAERSRYTTVVRLCPSPEAPWGMVPTFAVRLYHDANCAEVIEYQRRRNFRSVYAYPNRAMRQRDEKAQVNRLLGEFLSCCLSHGIAAFQPALTT